MATDNKTGVIRRGEVRAWCRERDQLRERIAHLERRLAAADALAALVHRAAQDSCTTSGEYGGPGCFYCDTEDGHTDDCEAAAALRAYQETKEQPAQGGPTT